MDFSIYFSIPSGYYTQRIKLRNSYLDPTRKSYGMWMPATKILNNKNGFAYEETDMYFESKEDEKKGINW